MSTIEKNRADNLRKEIFRDLKYVIRDLENLLNSVEAGDTLYTSSFHGSTILQLPGKIECHRMLERLMEEEER